jgi:hypothetical protein
MHRVAHTSTNAANHMALLSVRIHAKTQTIPIQAKVEHGLTIAMLCPPKPYQANQQEQEQ